MNKKILSLMLVPVLLAGCSVTGEGDSGSSGQGGGSITHIEQDEYDSWANSWSKPGHLYFHYNRGEKMGYENYCLWLWQHDPQDLEGALWGFSADPKVSEKLTLKPMSTSFMTYKDVGAGDSEETFIDNYGVIIDVDYTKEVLTGGKSGKDTTYQGATELGFLLPQQDSMSGVTNWVSDGGRETYVEGIEYKDGNTNWRTVEGGKALHLFVATGALDDYAFFAGEGTPEAKTNPIDTDITGQYSSSVDTKYTNTLGNSATSVAFRDGYIDKKGNKRGGAGVGYQVFVASFRDSNNDGKGDLRGIIQAVEEGFFDDLNVDTLWLTPIQKSDSYHGYDISDYYAVDKKFGTVDDYAELIYKCHDHGIKVLMDLVLNHTSKSNKWFINSQWGVKDEIKWRDVYTWKFESDKIEKWNGSEYKTITVKEDAESDSPSWYRDGESHYYYYGKFGSGMPEINYLSAATRKLVINMAKYWLSFGLDGFRLDAVKHIFMRDECYQDGDLIIKDTGTKETYDDEKGKYVTKAYDYSSNITKNVMWWKEFAHGVKNAYPNCFLVGENFDGWGKQTAPYYQALDSQFSFSHYYHIPAYIYTEGGTPANFDNKQAGESYDVYASTGMTELDGKGFSVPCGGRKDFIDGPFTSNHDVMRAINQVNGSGTIAGTTPLEKVTGAGDQVNKAKIHAAITLLSQGLSWIYYGDELGMSSNTDKHVEKYGSKNSEDIWYRQPYLWKETAKRPNYKAGQYVFELDDYNKTLKSYEDQKNDENSVYRFYQALTAIKAKYPNNHKIQYMGSSNNILTIKVTGVGKPVVVYIHVGLNDASEFLLNPGSALGSEYENIGSINGAPTTGGADMGPHYYSVTAFRAK